MPKYSEIIQIFILAIFWSCGNGSGSDLSNSKEPLTNVLTLEFSFGDTGLPDKYLLAQPTGLQVAENGDIIVGDERSLKIFDSKGNPKQIVGGLGEGPGEFGRSYSTTLSETGYITVATIGGSGSYNLFGPDYEFVERVNLANAKHKSVMAEYNWSRLLYNRIYSYSPDERVIRTQAWVTFTGGLNNGWTVIHETPEESSVLAVSQDYMYDAGGFNTILFEAGLLLMQPISNRRIVYSNSAEDKFTRDGESFYKIYIYDLSTQETMEIERSYVPFAFPDSVINPPLEYPENLSDESRNRRDERNRIRSDKLRELEFYPAIRQIKSDNNFIFVNTFNYKPGEGYLIEVFDADRREYRSSFYIPFDNYTIKNRMLYHLKTSRNDFPVIEVFSINPKVYH